MASWRAGNDRRGDPQADVRAVSPDAYRSWLTRQKAAIQANNNAVVQQRKQGVATDTEADTP
jgi:heme/copper-type cytochrome/quinol oxidase subunit 2